MRNRIRALALYMNAASGVRGRLAVVRVLIASRLGRGSGKPVAVALRRPRGLKVFVRPGTTDLSNAASYSHAAVYRPPTAAGDPRRIVELGSNIGAGLSALALEYPGALLAGVEPDTGNLDVARLNTRPFGSRVQLLQGAIWDTTVDLVVDSMGDAGEHGFTVRAAAPGDPPQLPRIRAYSIDDVLDLTFPGEEIDYMHVTIEGTEPRVFAAGGSWPDRVRSLRVEAHPYFGYEVEDCVAQLEALGYAAEAAAAPPRKWVMAVRR